MRLTPCHLTLESSRHDRAIGESAGEAAARLAAVARLLPAEDRRLVDLLIHRGLTQRAAAAELGLAPGVVARRLRRVRNMLASPTVRAIADHADSLAPPIRQLAISHFFRRVPVAVLCEQSGMTRRDVQGHLDYVRGWARALHRAAIRTREAARRRAADNDNTDTD